MKKIFIKILGSSIIATLLIVPLLSVRAETGGNKVPPPPRIGKMVRATSTEMRLENRENNIERIRARIASTTASSTKKIEKLNDRLQKQQDQMNKVKERLLDKELKITDVLGKIADKMQSRIDILAGKGLDMTAAKAKLAVANAKIAEITAEADKLATLASTTITEANQAQLFTDIKAEQAKIRTMAFDAHALLVDTIKEITKVLPKNGENENATGTATSTI